MVTKGAKAAVSARAVLQRVNRRLAKDYEQIRTWRSSGRSGGMVWSPGDYYHIDFNRNAMLEVNVDLEAYARDLGVLQPWESLA